MDEHQLRTFIEAVRAGQLARRDFLGLMSGCGLTGPMASMLLMSAGVSHAQVARPDDAARRVRGGNLKLIWWQGPTLLNPHFAGGLKDEEAARIFYEPLAAWDNDANLVAVLAAEIPSLANGGLAPDGRSVLWRLKQGVKWHDGEPFTADDVVFNWEFARDPAAAAATAGSFGRVTVEKVDSHAVRVVFARPSPFWATAVATSMLVPKHRFASYMGEKSREAPANLRPVGTGPYRIVTFNPGDMVRGERNPHYHIAGRPWFDRIELKGGGDAASAARAVIQTGDYDYAWNLLVEDELLARMEPGGKGKVSTLPSGNIELIMLNPTDPWTEVEGERASIRSRHFAFSDAAVRKAIGLLVDRDAIGRFIFGRTGVATANYLNGPPRFRPPDRTMEFSVARANELLDAAGWMRGADGIRQKAGRKLRLVFQTSVNGPRQKVQAIVKSAFQKAGIAIELKSVTPSIFFSSDVADPDTNVKFWSDVQMYQIAMVEPDPESMMRRFLTTEVASKANKWQGVNNSRWRSDEFDRLHELAMHELDPIRRASFFIRMNHLVVDAGHIIPIVNRKRVQAYARNLAPQLTGWDLDMAFVHEWYRVA